MSQQTNAGFNAPGFSVCADGPSSVGPACVICAAWQVSCGEPFRSISRNVPPSERTFFSPSAERGVGYSAAWRGNWSSRVRVEPSGLVPIVDMPGVSFQSRADGVAQSAAVSFAMIGNGGLLW